MTLEEFFGGEVEFLQHEYPTESVATGAALMAFMLANRNHPDIPQLTI